MSGSEVWLLERSLAYQRNGLAVADPPHPHMVDRSVRWLELLVC